MTEPIEKKRCRIVLVTGTDTGVGKTVVGCGLVAALVRRGVKVTAIKPVESGVGPEISSEEDGVRLAMAAGQSSPQAALDRLAAPLAPPVAADREGVTLDPERWITAVERYAQTAEVVLVEGAGGLLSPLTWDFTARCLARRLNAGAVVVVGDRLGCVNHTLLTLEALEQARIPVLGTILSPIGAEDESVGGNLETLRRFTGLERITAIPRVKNPEEAAASLEAAVDWILR